MNAVTLDAPRRPRHPQRTASSFLLALLMHLALFGGLTLVVNWRTESEAPAVAELWGAVPPEPVVLPPPAPPKPVETPKQEEADIALKVEKRPPPEIERKPEPPPEKKPEPKPEPKKPEPPKVDLKKLEEKKKLDEAKRLEAQREAVRKAEQERMLAQIGNPGGSKSGVEGGTGRRDAEYAAILQACIRPHIAFVVPEGTSPQVSAQFRIEVLPTGEQTSVRLVKPSGLAGYDAAAERAIRRCDPIPRKRDGTIDRTIVVDMKPVESKP